MEETELLYRLQSVTSTLMSIICQFKTDFEPIFSFKNSKCFIYKILNRSILSQFYDIELFR